MPLPLAAGVNPSLLPVHTEGALASYFPPLAWPRFDQGLEERLR